MSEVSIMVTAHTNEESYPVNGGWFPMPETIEELWGFVSDLTHVKDYLVFHPNCEGWKNGGEFVLSEEGSLSVVVKEDDGS